jgi:hypothetical protein
LKGGDMAIVDLVNKTQLLMSQNSTVLLTGVGVVGTVSTAVLTGRASFKAAEVILLEEEKFSEPDDRLSFRERADLVWPQFIPPIGVGVATIAAIVFANRLSAKEAAALATAYGISEKALQEYKQKVIEKVGETKEQKFRDEIAQDKVREIPPTSSQIVIAGNTNTMCFDLLTGRYFESNMEKLKRAENTINFQILNHMYASLSSFYDEIGLPATEFSDTVGWNSNNPLEVSYSSVLSTDDRPCIAISFANAPTLGYDRLY